MTLCSKCIILIVILLLLWCVSIETTEDVSSDNCFPVDQKVEETLHEEDEFKSSLQNKGVSIYYIKKV